MAYPISDVPRRIVYSGSAGVGPYAFTFEVLTASDIAVYKNQTLLTLTTDYTVSINTGTGTGTVTLVVAATGADTVTLVGDRAIQRASDFVTGGDLFANTLNAELDAQTIYAQQIDEKAERAIRAPVTDPTTLNMVLPSASDRASKYLAFSSTGDPIATAGSSSTNPVSVTMEPFVQASTLEAARTILGISDGAVTAAKIERVAANQVLRSTGVSSDPVWGSLNLTTDVTGTLPVANGGTGAATLTANSVLLGNGTSALQEVAPGASGNLLTSNGTTWTSSSLVVGMNGAVLTASNPGWTIPAGVTKLKVTVVGGGGGGGTATALAGNTVVGGAGGGGCTAIKWLSGLTPGQTLNVTIGAGGTPGTAGNQSSVASGTATITTISANGGGAGTTISSGGTIAGASGSGSSTSAGADITYGGNDGLAFTEASGTNAFSIGGSSAFGGGASKQSAGAGVNGKSYGGGASGGVVISASSTATGGTGAGGVVIFEW